MTLPIVSSPTDANVTYYMDDVIAKLKSALMEVKVSVSGSTTVSVFGFEVVGSSTSKAAVLAMLQADEVRLSELMNQDYRAVMSGTWTLDRWTNKANLIGQDIRYNGGLVGEFSARGVVAATAAQTISDVKTGTSSILKDIDAPLTKYAIIVIVLMLLFVVIKFQWS